MFVYKIQVNPIYTIFKYGNYYDFNDRFLLFPQCFQKASFNKVINSHDCVVKSLLNTVEAVFRLAKVFNPFPEGLRFYWPWMIRLWEKVVEKRENSGNQHFLRFPHFLPYKKQKS